MAVDLDDGGVDHGELHVWLVRAGLEKPNENIGFDPITVSLEDRVPVAEEGWQVTPWTPRARDPQYRLDEEPVVAAASSGVGRLAQAMRFHSRPLGVRQHESFHPKLESQSSSRWNPKSQQTLAHVDMCRHHLRAVHAGESGELCWCDEAGEELLVPSSLQSFGRHGQFGWVTP